MIPPLSQAIRLGSTLKPQWFGYFYRYDNTGAAVASCALGAALDAIGLDPVEPLPAEWKLMGHATFPFPIFRCPEECAYIAYTLFSAITHLNDGHQWSRERIADYVELHEALPHPSGIAPCDTAGAQTHEDPNPLTLIDAGV